MNYLIIVETIIKFTALKKLNNLTLNMYELIEHKSLGPRVERKKNVHDSGDDLSPRVSH